MPDLLDLHNLNVQYQEAEALRGVSLTLRRGEILGIVGESGSGKTTLINAILNILPSSASLTADRMQYKNTDLLQLSQTGWREHYGSEIGVIFQNPEAALNPLVRIRTQFVECICANSSAGRRDAIKTARATLEKMQLTDPDTVLNAYPFQLSGGMLQRVMIAMALCLKPSLIIADEPTSALDAFTQKAIINEFINLKKQHEIGMLFITHDIRVASHIADRLLVMYQGRIVEHGQVDSLLANPQHDYTKKLLGNIITLAEKVLSQSFPRLEHDI